MYDMVRKLKDRVNQKWTLLAQLTNHSTVSVDDFIYGDIYIEVFLII